MRRLIALAGMAAWLGGCQTVAVSSAPLAVARRTDDGESYALKRVALVPVEGPRLPAERAESLQRALQQELALAAGFEVVLLSESDVQETVESEPHRRGWYDPRTILALAERFQVDGLLVGTVTDLELFPPQLLGLQMDLVACETGMVVWSASLHLDAADERVRHGVETYRGTRRSNAGEVEPADLTLLSPERFARFAAFELARVL